MLIFDIETAPLPDCDLRRIMGEPQVDLPPPGEFDPASVKVGNLKDEAKIAEKIAAAKAEHEAAAASYETRLAEAQAAAFADFKSKAALSAVTGYVLCIGYYSPKSGAIAIDDGDNDETKLLRNFWRKFTECAKSGRSMIGLNIFDFDLPFIMRRSWQMGADVPAGVLGNGRYWHSTFVDLRKLWLCGQMPGSCRSSFDEMARAFGTKGKPAGVNGADFARLWEEDREAAVAYLESDLRQPAEWAKWMGVC